MTRTCGRSSAAHVSIWKGFINSNFILSRRGAFWKRADREMATGSEARPFRRSLAGTEGLYRALPLTAPCLRLQVIGPDLVPSFGLQSFLRVRVYRLEISSVSRLFVIPSYADAPLQPGAEFVAGKNHFTPNKALLACSNREKLEFLARNTYHTIFHRRQQTSLLFSDVPSFTKTILAPLYEPELDGHDELDCCRSGSLAPSNWSNSKLQQSRVNRVPCHPRGSPLPRCRHHFRTVAPLY